jgi:hypothetical protein
VEWVIYGLSREAQTQGPVIPSEAPRRTRSLKNDGRAVEGPRQFSSAMPIQEVLLITASLTSG